MRTFARSHRRSATRAARRCPPGLPLHKVLAVVVLIPHASRLRYFALDAPIRKAAFVDPVEHRAHRRRGHPIEVREHDLAALGGHLEPTVVPLFRVDDGARSAKAVRGIAFESCSSTVGNVLIAPEKSF